MTLMQQVTRSPLLYPLLWLYRRFARGGGAGVVILSEWDKDFPLAEPEKGQTLDYGKQLPTS